MSMQGIVRVLLAAALAIAQVASAQTSAARPGAERQARAYSHGLLWKVEGRSGAPSYVFGTIHVADPRVLALPAPVRQNFDAAGAFAMEVSLDSVNVAQLASRMVFSDGRDLPGVVGPALYEKIVASAPAIGVPPEALRLFKPWAIALFLIMPATDAENVLDQRLYRMAVEQKKALHQLETVDEQADTFDRMSETDQIAFLRSAVENRDQFPRIIQRTIALYLERDLAALHRLSADYGSDDPATARLAARFMQRLIDERNVRMADRAEALLKAGGAFVAVGALHLYGERGMLAMLARKGYRVTLVY